MKLNRMPNSIDTLSPNDPFVKIMNALPLAKDVPYHSIIGDRGRGDTPNSSDGVVPVLELACRRSQIREDCAFGSRRKSKILKGIAEVIRILKEHIESKGLVTKGSQGFPRYRSLRAHLRWHQQPLICFG